MRARGPAESEPSPDPFAAACRYLTARERCAEEVRAYLRRRGFEEERVEATLDRLRSEHLVDDRRYARIYVESRSRNSPRSGSLLVRELRRRGVEAETARAVVGEFLREVPEETLARRVLQKVRPGGEDWKQRAARRLRARGFRAAWALREPGDHGRFDPEDDAAGGDEED